MGALTLGPLVLSLDRAFAGLGFMILLLGAAWLSRRGHPDRTDWAWRTALAAFVGARLGFVLTHGDFYLSNPAAILAIWQGGFAPWWGVAAATLATLPELWRTAAVRAPTLSLALLALAGWLLPATRLTPRAADLNVSLPDVVLVRLDGTPVSLHDGGGPVVVNVWATWCPPCRRELPLLLATAARSDDVRIALVNQRETSATVGRYLAREGLDDDGVLLDERGAVGSALRSGGLPTTYAFDGDGRLVDLHVGELSGPTLDRLVRRAR